MCLHKRKSGGGSLQEGVKHTCAHERKMYAGLHSPRQTWSLDFTMSSLQFTRAQVQCTQKPAGCPELRPSESDISSVCLSALSTAQPEKKTRFGGFHESTFCLPERSGPDKDRQLSETSTWEQSSPGQCFGPLIQKPTRTYRRSFLNLDIMLSRDLPDIEVDYCVHICFLFFPFPSALGFCIYCPV